MCPSLCSADFAPRVCAFNLSASVIGFSVSSDEFVENKQLVHESTIDFLLSVTNIFHSYFIKAINHSFYGFTGAINHLGRWENTTKACKSRTVQFDGLINGKLSDYQIVCEDLRLVLPVILLLMKR